MPDETQQMQHEADELRAVAELLDALNHHGIFRGSVEVYWADMLMGVCVVEDESDGHWVYEPRRRL